MVAQAFNPRLREGGKSWWIFCVRDQPGLRREFKDCQGLLHRETALKETKHRLGRKTFGKRIGKSFEYFHTVGLVTS